MTFLTKKRCVLGEGPIWNPIDKKLYFTNGFTNEICSYDPVDDEIVVRMLDKGIAAIAFSKDGRMLISRSDGAFYLNDDGSVEPLYDREKYQIEYGNDAKVGPDGRFYIGTQSKKRAGASGEIDGKLYSIDKYGNVDVLLDGLILSNGFDWSMDETKFYHTDSDTNIIKEYNFDKENGKIYSTGRFVEIRGVDGFTIDRNDRLLVACWGKGYISVVDTEKMCVAEYIELPVKIPSSCGFMGEDLNTLAITTVSWSLDTNENSNDGFTILKKMKVGGRKPYLFG